MRHGFTIMIMLIVLPAHTLIYGCVYILGVYRRTSVVRCNLFSAVIVRLLKLSRCERRTAANSGIPWYVCKTVIHGQARDYLPAK